jgi:anti-sigma regulatory factor (Ser/Thr protein kinase)
LRRQAGSTAHQASAATGCEAFRHEALLYAGLDGFLDATLPFLRGAVDAREPTLVVVSAAKIARLRAELGPSADHIIFADMREVGLNPARIIPAWRAFFDRHAPAGGRLRGVGEPIWAQRSAEELVECQRHEALLNLAFAEAKDFWLLCPYDIDALDAAVIEAAHYSHPVILEDGSESQSATYVDLEAVAAPFADPLAAAPAGAHELAFTTGTLAAVRAFVAVHAAAAGLGEPQGSDLVLAVNEIATNSVRYGGGRGVVRLWLDGDALVCEVVDSGGITEPLAGRKQPTSGQMGGHGLWLVNQICDLVQVRVFAKGGAVRMRMRLA